MNKIIGCLLALGLLFSPRAFAKDNEFIWLSKPVLCGNTEEVLKDLESSGFIPIAKSTIVRDNDDKVLGSVYYMKKDKDFAIIEIFRERSCIISISKYFVLFKLNKENEL